MSDGWIELENGLIAETSEPPRPSFFISRSELPAAKVEHKKRVPLWSIIKSAMGKNLYDEHLPIEFYEPLSLLQCLAEPLQNDYLIHKAIRSSDSMERLEYIGAFAAAALSLIRVSKPFNPMLRETYELEREDLGFRFVAEQVSENPPTSAFHCTGAGYDFHGQISPFVKMSMTAKITVDPKASFTLRLIGHKEEYKWQSINVIVHNCVRGDIFHALDGTLKVRQYQRGKPTGKEFQLKYRDAKTSGAEYMITGQVVDGSKAVCRIYGNWSSYLATCPPASFSDCVFEQRFRSHCDGAFPSSRVLYTDSKKLWIHYKRPNNASQYYGFTFFAMSANHLISPRSALLPRTDTRLRPDVRLMENGKFEQSLTETKRLQARTKGNEITVVSNNPKWFTEYQETGSSTIFKYNGLYWKRSFEGCADIFGLP